LNFTDWSTIINTMTKNMTKQLIMEAAFELFYTRSYTAVGVQEICQKAGVKKGSFYHFFASKQALMIDVLDMSWQRFYEGVIKPTLASHQPPLTCIAQFLSYNHQHQCNIKETEGIIKGCPYGNLASELSTQDDVIRQHVKQLFSRVVTSLDKCLQRAVAEGELDENLNTQQWAKYILAQIEGSILLAKVHNDLQYVENLSTLLLSTLKASRS